jgi:hypothetical protein
MILNALALIGGLWIGAKAVSSMRWHFFTNRNGNSGVGSGRHWSIER